MTQLVSKVQLINYETGEFSDIKPRSIDEVIDLIREFPWSSQRIHLDVQLTNPSITIEKNGQEFLKFAVYYKGSFVLHYLNEKQELFTKSFLLPDQAFPYIRQFFECYNFDVTDFRKENTWGNNLRHFVTRHFEYFVTPRRAIGFLLSTSVINLLLSVLILVMFVVLRTPENTPLVLISAVMFFAGGGLNLLLFFNYYFRSKGRKLIMSRGNKIFYYGTSDALIEYNKGEMEEVIRYKSSGSRNPIGEFAVVKIKFRHGTQLQIPNILLDDDALMSKLWEYPQIEENRVPWLKGKLVS